MSQAAKGWGREARERERKNYAWKERGFAWGYLDALLFDGGDVHARSEIRASFSWVELQDGVQALRDQGFNTVPAREFQ